MMVENQGWWGTFPKYKARLGYGLVLGPIILVMTPPCGFTIHIISTQVITDKWRATISWAIKHYTHEHMKFSV
jgi:hypothetical protein